MTRRTAGRVTLSVFVFAISFLPAGPPTSPGVGPTGRIVSVYRSAISLLPAGPPTLFAMAQETSRSVWDAVYTEEQAARGLAAYVEQCSTCHGRDLEGADMTPPLTGSGFLSNWDGLSVGDLYERIRVSMPLNRPGSLTRQENADVIAYLLRFSQFPAGKQELSRDTAILKQILIKAVRPE